MKNIKFTGTHFKILDEKSRVLIPANFRNNNDISIFRSDFYAIPHIKKFLIIKPEIIFERDCQRIRDHYGEDSELANKFISSLYHNSEILRPDALNRLVLPKSLREKIFPDQSDEKQNVVILGDNDCFLIKPENLYKGERESIAEMSAFIDEIENHKYE